MYKMKCPRCNCEMNYTKDIALEAKGYISMVCEDCKEDFLVPIENPDLHKINKKYNGM